MTTRFVPQLKTDYLKSRATSIEAMPYMAKRFYDEILEIEQALDSICPGWDAPMRRGASSVGMVGLMNFVPSSPEELGEAKRLLLLRKLRWCGRNDEVIISYCAKTGRPTVIPIKLRR